MRKRCLKILKQKVYKEQKLPVFALWIQLLILDEELEITWGGKETPLEQVPNVVTICTALFILCLMHGSEL